MISFLFTNEYRAFRVVSTYSIRKTLIASFRRTVVNNKENTFVEMSERLHCLLSNYYRS
jgi:hypothetical protein